MGKLLRLGVHFRISTLDFVVCLSAIRSDSLIGIAYHFGSYKRFSIRNALVVFDDLSLDVIQGQIDV